MAKTQPVYKTIRSKFFVDFCDIFKSLLSLNDKDIISNMCDASLDDSNKESLVYLYDGKYNNMDTVKLDDMTMPFLHYMKNERRLKYFEQPKAVDAICVNQNNEWFLIEFKNCPIYKNTKKGKELNSDVLASIRQKMFGSLWLLLTLSSFSRKNLFGDDVTEFARTHFTYIAVVSREKNPDEFRRIHECPNNRYTPPYLSKYVGYYFKDVYMLTENEFSKFISDFKN